MPIVVKQPQAIVGTKLRYIRPTSDCSEYELYDITVGSTYVVAGYDRSGLYFFDDAGDRNFAANADGLAIFEIVD